MKALLLALFLPTAVFAQESLFAYHNTDWQTFPGYPQGSVNQYVCKPITKYSAEVTGWYFAVNGKADALQGTVRNDGQIACRLHRMPIGSDCPTEPVLDPIAATGGSLINAFLYKAPSTVINGPAVYLEDPIRLAANEQLFLWAQVWNDSTEPTPPITCAIGVFYRWSLPKLTASQNPGSNPTARKARRAVRARSGTSRPLS